MQAPPLPPHASQRKCATSALRHARHLPEETEPVLIAQENASKPAQRIAGAQAPPLQVPPRNSTASAFRAAAAACTPLFPPPKSPQASRRQEDTWEVSAARRQPPAASSRPFCKQGARHVRADR